jgi:hypothetical protein
MDNLNELRIAAKELQAIKDNLESCEQHRIDNTGGFVRQQYIADEMEYLDSLLKKGG